MTALAPSSTTSNPRNPELLRMDWRWGWLVSGGVDWARLRFGFGMAIVGIPFPQHAQTNVDIKQDAALLEASPPNAVSVKTRRKPPQGKNRRKSKKKVAREPRKCGSKVMGKGKFKNKPTGERQFSTLEEILAGTSTARPATFQKRCEELGDAIAIDNTQEYEVVERRDRRKGVEGLIEVENPNLAKPVNVKLKNIDFGKQTERSRREGEEVGRQQTREQSKKLREQGKTEQARKDLERLSLLRHEREIAAKRREEERAAKEEAARRKLGS